MHIAFGHGRGALLSVVEMTFEELGERCSRATKGNKYGEYFLRGGDITLTDGDPTHYNPSQRVPHFHRNNKTLLKSELLIIDGDTSLSDPNSAPPIELIHEELKKLKLKHFIYTTHSHSPPEKNRWRAVFPCKVDFEDVKKNGDSVKITTNKIVNDLKHTELAVSVEQNVWSQPWYLPSRDDPDDGLFEYFEYFEGDGVKAVNPDTVPEYDYAKPISKQTALGYETVDDIYNDFLSGKHCYTSIRKITYMNLKDGWTIPATIANARALMMGSPLKQKDPDRWKGTYDQIEALVHDGHNKINENTGNIDRNKDEDSYDEDLALLDNECLLPKDCLLTELTLALYKTWWTPNILVARLAAFSIVAYLAGGKYKSNLGDRVNIQQVAVGKTGSGKDLIINSLLKVIEKVWEEQPSMRDGILYGVVEEAGSAEGIDMKIRSMGHKHDIILVLDEIGGLMRQAKRDSVKQKIFDYILKMYTKADGVSAERAIVRKMEPGMAEILYAPTLVISSATTPEMMIGGIESNFVNYGNAARMMFFNVSPYAEDNVKATDDLVLSKNMIDNLIAIYDQTCISSLYPLPNARIYSPKSVDMSKIADVCWTTAMADKKIRGEFKDVWNRRVANAKKYAMIRAILNNPNAPQVDIDMINNELKFVGDACNYAERLFSNVVGESSMDAAKKSVLARLLKARERGKTRVEQKTLNDTYAMRKIMPQQRKAVIAELVEDDIIIKSELTKPGARGKKTYYYELNDEE